MRMCTEYEDMISAFIDGALTEGDRAALMEHMASCPACQEYFDQQIALHDALLADAESIHPPEDLVPDVMAHVRFTPQEKRKEPAVRWQRWVALAACCAIAALALWRGGAGPRQVNVSRSAADACPATVEDCGETVPPAKEDPAVSVPESTPEEQDDTMTAPPSLNSAPPPEETAGGGNLPDAGVQAAPQPDGAPQMEAEPLEEGKRAEPGQRTAGDVGAMVAGAAPAADESMADPSDGTALLSHEPEAAKAPRTILTASPAAAAWVEEALGLPWTAGGRYELTAGEYAQLREVLDAGGADYTEQPGDEDAEEFLLIAESGPETDG